MAKDTLLLELTGRDSAAWVARVQALIWAHVDDPTLVHPDTHVAGWVAALGREVEDSLLIDRSKRDENMASAAALAVILTAWAVRIQHAKAHDPNRPLEHRRAGSARASVIARAIFDAAFDETQDAVYFAGQRWEYPFAEDATDGTFV